MRWTRIRALLPAAGLGLLTLVVLGACGGESPSSSPSPPATEEPSTPGAAPSTVSEAAPPVVGRPVLGAPADAHVFVGEVEPYQFLEVHFSVPGVVDRVYVGLGDEVDKGTYLARLAVLDREEKLKTTRHHLDNARRASPGGRQHRPGDEPPAYLDAEMRRRLAEIQARGNTQRSDLRRLRRELAREGQEGATREALRQAHQRTGKSRRQSVSKRSAEDRVAARLIDDLKQQQAGLQRAIEDSTVASPIRGKVVGVNIEEGQQVTTRGARPAFVLLDPMDLVVRIAVPVGLASVLQEKEETWLDVGPRDGSVAGFVLSVDPTPYESLREGVGMVRDVLVAPRKAGSAGLAFGQAVRVAIRR